MKRTFLVAVVVALVSGFIMTGCGKPTPAAAPAAQQLDIGVASPLTGTMAFLGGESINGILMAIEDQNAHGGVTIGGQNYMLNPIQRDTKADLIVAKSVAEELVFDKKVKIISGPFQSDAVGMQSCYRAE